MFAVSHKFNFRPTEVLGHRIMDLAGPKSLNLFHLVSFCLQLINLSLSAEIRFDLKSLFRQYYALTENDFILEYELNGQANYTIRNVFGYSFMLQMSEELTVFDTEPNPFIEMCNGTVVKLGEPNNEKGISYGSIDKRSKLFRGQFIVDGITYYVEDAYPHMSLFDVRLDSDRPDYVSILYSSLDVVMPEMKDEAPAIPKDLFNNNSEAEDFPTSERRAPRERQICLLDIWIDYGVYQDHGNDLTKVKNLVYQQLMSVNRIFTRDFDNTVEFQVGRFSYANDEFCRKHPRYIICNPKYQSHNDFLDQFADLGHRKYCLSYLYTNRNFDKTLGVAYVGGLCSSNSRRSFNTGFVVLNDKTTQANADLTLAHEIGHNFGCQHDPSNGFCSGDSIQGSFIMAPYSSHYRKPNNEKFSSCSKFQARKTLNQMMEKKRSNCFRQQRGQLVQGAWEDLQHSPSSASEPCDNNAIIFFKLSIMIMLSSWLLLNQ